MKKNSLSGKFIFSSIFWLMSLIISEILDAVLQEFSSLFLNYALINMLLIFVILFISLIFVFLYYNLVKKKFLEIFVFKLYFYFKDANMPFVIKS